MPRFLPSSTKGLLHETSNKMKQKRKINQTRLEQTRQKSRNLTSGRRKKMGSGAAWLPSKRLRRRQPFTIIMYTPSAVLTVAVVLCFELWAQLMSLKIYQWTCFFRCCCRLFRLMKINSFYGVGVVCYDYEHFELCYYRPFTLWRHCTFTIQNVSVSC